MITPADSPRDGIALENAIGGKVAVWVGAIALALGGVFLVKLSIEHGWMPPELRVLGGMILGLGLAGAAWRLRDRSNYVAQGLAAAAVIDIYACLWAAVELYHLIDPWVGIVGMVFTTLAAVGLALRLGPLVAVIGLLGAFLAPLLLGRQSEHTEGLFAYLLALQAGSQFLARRRRWIWASGISLTAGALWVLAHLLGGGGQVLPGIFLIASTAVFVMPELLRPSAGKAGEIAVWAASAVGTLLLALTLGYSGYEPQQWAFFGVLVVGTGALSLWQRRYARLPWLTFGVTLVLSAVQLPHGGWDADSTLALALVFGGLFALIGYAGLWRASGRQLVPLVVAAPAAFLFVALPKVGFAFDATTWMWVLAATGGTYWLMLIPALVTRNAIERRQLHWLVTPALVVTAAAWPFGLEPHWCGMLWAAELLVAAGLDWRFNLGSARLAGAGLVGALLVCLASPAALVTLQDIGTRPLLNWPSMAYLMAIAACVGARRLQTPHSSARSLVSISAILLALAWAGVNIHHAANHGIFATTHISALETSAHVFVLLLAATALMQRAPHLRNLRIGDEAIHLREFGVGLGLMAAFLGALLLASVGNPWVRHEPVIGTIVLNTLLLGLGVPALFTGLLAYSYGARGYRTERVIAWYCAGGLILLMTMLQVRHAFHGAVLWRGEAVEAEHYGYSFALAVLALLALGLGIRRNSRQLRVIALVGMLACSIKVFGYDMRQLQGVFRVLSFLGLGASLMALGYVYNRFGPKPRAKPTPEIPPPAPEVPYAPPGSASRAVLDAYLARNGTTADQEGLLSS